MPDQPQAAPPAAPIIRRLTIERFRGIEALTWHPAPGVNVILGGGDVGKTTVLEAIALLLSPDKRRDDFRYRLLPPRRGREFRDRGCRVPARRIPGSTTKSALPGRGTGTASTPWCRPRTVKARAGEPVYKLRVRGTSDLELAFEVLQPDGSADPLSVALRRSIGLVRLAGDDRGDRDLRLVQGSALDKLVSDNALRSRIATELAGTDIEEELLPAGKKALEDLDDAFTDEGLPDTLGLSIIGGPGPSIASLIGLTADKDDVSLPLTMWGAGTRRLSALAITAFNQRSAPITIVDEVERGLEPYRQRRLIGKLQDGSAQVFLTTHSPSTIAAAAKSRFWYVDAAGKIGRLDEAKIARHRANDPAAFLSRFAVIAEGKTEVGSSAGCLRRRSAAASTSTAFMSATAAATNRRSTFSKRLPRAVLRSAASPTMRVFIRSAGERSSRRREAQSSAGQRAASKTTSSGPSTTRRSMRSPLTLKGRRQASAYARSRSGSARPTNRSLRCAPPRPAIVCARSSSRPRRARSPTARPRKTGIT